MSRVRFLRSDDRLRVLIANPAADLYGSDRMMIETAVGLAGRGCQVLVVCGQPGLAVDELGKSGIEVLVRDVPVIRKGLMNVRGLLKLAAQCMASLPRLLRLLGACRPDVVLVNTVTQPLWLVAARLARVPVAVHVHEAEQAISKVTRLALSGPLFLADSVIFNSEASRAALGSSLLNWLVAVQVVPNGVAGPDSVEAARLRLDLPLRVVYVGRLSPRKAPDLAIAAIQELDRRGIRATLTLVGDVFPGYEWYEHELKARVDESALADRIYFAGFQASVWPFLAEADVAVVPSRLDESFGNTLVEAVLAGRPAVASDHTGLREIGAGLKAVVLVANDSATAIADGLQKVVAAWPTYRAAAKGEANELATALGPERYSADMYEALTATARQRLPEKGRRSKA